MGKCENVTNEIVFVMDYLMEMLPDTIVYSLELYVKKINNTKSDRDKNWYNAMCILSSNTMIYTCYFKKSIVYRFN